MKTQLKKFRMLEVVLNRFGVVGQGRSVIATLPAQHHKIYAVDIIPEKVELINNRKSPIQDTISKNIL